MNLFLRCIDQHEKRVVFILFVLFLFIEAFFFIKLGVRTSWDTVEYINGSKAILNFELPSSTYLSYISYSFFLAIFFGLGGTIKAIVIAQIIVASIALYCFHLLAKQYLGLYFGLLASVLFAIWPSVRFWDSYIYTESLFTSSLVICLYLLLNNKKWAGIGVFIFTLFVRPPGLVFGFSILFTVLVSDAKPAIRVWLLLSLLALTTVFLIVFDQFAATLITSYAKGEVIFPDVLVSIKAFTIMIPKPSFNHYLEVFLFIVLNPILFLKLFLIKVCYFIFGIKPYYTLSHNLFNFSSQFLLILFSGIAIFSKSTDFKSKLFVSVFIGLTILMVGFTTENWDGRFLVPIMPILIISACVGFRLVFRKLSH